VTTYSICAASGRAGPKRREGDFQVPEGFYAIDMFNPRSRFHLSMRVDYPNARDRALRSTGGQIMIHGDCMSVGCVAISDERIEELWVMARALRKGRPRVLLLPGRDLEAFIADTDDPELARFWEGLLAVDQAFAAEHVMPRVTWNDAGVYRPRD
jgi:murein L,D-transpeptidase YafK